MPTSSTSTVPEYCSIWPRRTLVISSGRSFIWGCHLSLLRENRWCGDAQDAAVAASTGARSEAPRGARRGGGGREPSTTTPPTRRTRPPTMSGSTDSVSSTVLPVFSSMRCTIALAQVVGQGHGRDGLDLEAVLARRHALVEGPGDLGELGDAAPVEQHLEEVAPPAGCAPSVSSATARLLGAGLDLGVRRARRGARPTSRTASAKAATSARPASTASASAAAS